MIGKLTIVNQETLYITGSPFQTNGLKTKHMACSLYMFVLYDDFH